MSDLKIVRLTHEYVVPDEFDAVAYAKECLYEDITRWALKSNLWESIEIVDAPVARRLDVPEFLEDYIEEQRAWEQEQEGKSARTSVEYHS